MLYNFVIRIITSIPLVELMKKDVRGWFKLLGQAEGEFYNVPIMEGDEAAAISAELEVFN